MNDRRYREHTAVIHEAAVEGGIPLIACEQRQYYTNTQQSMYHTFSKHTRCEMNGYFLRSLDKLRLRQQPHPSRGVPDNG